MLGLCSHIRRVRLKAALHRMVSVRHQSTARVIRADETYDFEWLSRYSDDTDHSVQRRFKSNTPTDWISQHCLVITWPSKRICSSELVRAAVWTVIRADKRSVWRDSNESRGFVPLLAHKHYIEHFPNFLYRFRGKLYRDNYRYRIIAQPYVHVIISVFRRISVVYKQIKC